MDGIANNALHTKIRGGEEVTGEERGDWGGGEVSGERGGDWGGESGGDWGEERGLGGEGRGD